MSFQSDSNLGTNRERTRHDNMMVENQHPDKRAISRREAKILEECTREAFFKYCLPLMAGFAISSELAGTYFKNSKRFPTRSTRITLSLIFGYLAGIIGSIRPCMERTAAMVPEGEFAREVRRKKAGGGHAGFPPVGDMSTNRQESGSMGEYTNRSHHGATSPSLNRKSVSGVLRQSEQERLGDNIEQDENKPKPRTSYAELRAKNRMKSVQGSYEDSVLVGESKEITSYAELNTKNRRLMERAVYGDSIVQGERKQKTSYAELRAKNRNQYNEQSTKDGAEFFTDLPPTQKSSGRRNQYGDLIQE